MPYEADLAGLEELRHRLTDIFDNLRHRLEKARQDEATLSRGAVTAPPVPELGWQARCEGVVSQGVVSFAKTNGDVDEVMSFHSDDCELIGLGSVPGTVSESPRDQSSTRQWSDVNQAAIARARTASPQPYDSEKSDAPRNAPRPSSVTRGTVRKTMASRNRSLSGSQQVLHRVTREFSKLQMTWSRDNGEDNRLDFVTWKEFAMLSALVIVANTVYLGVQTEASVREAFDSLEKPVEKLNWLAGDIIFAVLFAIELSLRMYSSGLWVFAFGKDKVWNLFDAFVVFFSVFEVVFDIIGEETSVGFSALRAIRLIKIFRILRVARIFPLIRHLQTMLYSLYGCLTSFVPAIFLLVTVMYIYSLSFMQGVQKYVETTPQADLDLHALELMKKYYGSISRTIWVLLAAVSGGEDWQRYVDPLSKAGGWYEFVFAVYICSVLFGLLNIVSGVFVHVAMQSSQMAREIAVDLAMAKKETLVKEIVEAFMEADQDKSGSLSWAEFHEYLADEKVQAYFMSFDIDVSCAEKIFNLIDTDQTGEVDLEEFVIGCLNYRGHAKSVDMTIMINRTREMDVRLKAIEKNMQLLLDRP